MISREGYKKPKIPRRLDFLWGRDEKRRCKLMFLFPNMGLSLFVEGRQKLVRSLDEGFIVEREIV
jgi:hypothetical protein